MWDRRTGGRAVRRTVAWAGGMLRRIAGMPDYGAYVEHLQRCHPERALPTEREYFEQYVAARYGDGPTRCC
ncbi:MAG TPA: YbdD/YjiX family protein [Gemmatimonadales bacterium]